MISLVGYNENASDFPDGSVEMRPASTPTIRERLRCLFGARDVVYWGRGYNNAHHRLIDVDGLPDLIVRRMLAPVDVLANRLDREYRVLEYLAQQGYPHAPRPVRRIALWEVDGSPAYAMTFVDGTSPKLSVDTVIELGKAVGLLHQLPVPDWLAQAGPTTEPLPILMSLWSNWQRNPEILGRMPAIHRSRVVALIEAIPGYLLASDWTYTTNALLHGDLGDHNLVRDATCVVLLDWEFASVSDPTLDIMWLFNREGFGDSLQDAFFEGYCEFYGEDIPPSWRERLRVLRAISLVELAIWAQSGIDDIEEGRNSHFFESGDREYLQRQVGRIHEAEI